MERNPSTVQEYERRLENVFDIALTELAATSPKARNLLDIMAFLNPDGISEEMLVMNITDHPTSTQQDGVPEDE